jgi:hypothetical protein
MAYAAAREPSEGGVDRFEAEAFIGMLEESGTA